MTPASMDHTYYVDGFGQLASIAREWQSREQSQHEKAMTTKSSICISLLQPLANPEMLAPCRDPLSKYLRNEHGTILPTETNHEYLNIEALRNIWRTELKELPLAMIEEVCFDLALPRKSDENTDGVVLHWDATLPKSGGVAVKTQEMMNLVVLLASTMKARKGGGWVGLSLKNEGGEGMSEGAVAQLGGSLERISAYRRGV